MAASIIQPKVLNPSRHPFFPPATGSFTQAENQTAATPAKPSSVSVQEIRARINARNQLYDLFTSLVAVVFVFCICAAMVATGAWVLFELSQK